MKQLHLLAFILLASTTTIHTTYYTRNSASCKTTSSANQEYDVSRDPSLTPLGAELLGKYSPARYKIKNLSLREHLKRERTKEESEINSKITNFYSKVELEKQALERRVSSSQNLFDHTATKNTSFKENLDQFNIYYKDVLAGMPSSQDEMINSSMSTSEKIELLYLIYQWLQNLNQRINKLKNHAQEIMLDSMLF